MSQYLSVIKSCKLNFISVSMTLSISMACTLDLHGHNFVTLWMQEWSNEWRFFKRRPAYCYWLNKLSISYPTSELCVFLIPLSIVTRKFWQVSVMENKHGVSVNFSLICKLRYELQSNLGTRVILQIDSAQMTWPVCALLHYWDHHCCEAQTTHNTAEWMPSNPRRMFEFQYPEYCGIARRVHSRLRPTTITV